MTRILVNVDGTTQDGSFEIDADIWVGGLFDQYTSEHADTL